MINGERGAVMNYGSGERYLPVTLNVPPEPPIAATTEWPSPQSNGNAAPLSPTHN